MLSFVQCLANEAVWSRTLHVQVRAGDGVLATQLDCFRGVISSTSPESIVGTNHQLTRVNDLLVEQVLEHSPRSTRVSAVLLSQLTCAGRIRATLASRVRVVRIRSEEIQRLGHLLEMEPESNSRVQKR